MAPDAEVKGWSHAYRFNSFEEAGTAYEACRDVIFDGDADASVYRIQLNGTTYVVVLGFGDAEAEFFEQFDGLCDKGESDTVPDEVLIVLALRRQEFHTPGTKFERRSGM